MQPDGSKGVAVVTGAAGGIGLATVRRLLAAGRSIAMLDHDERAIVQSAAALREDGGVVRTFTLDVRDGAATRGIAEQIETEMGAVDALVTCAGITRSAPAETMDLESWKAVLDINLTGTFLSCQAFAAAMLRRRKGSIVTISSISGTGGQAGRANYAASKWAVIGLTKTLAIEWGGRGVRVNAVAPGAIATALFAKVPDDFRDGVILARTPLARAAEPVEVADAIVYLLSDGASYINGAVLNVDGGFSAGYATHKSGVDMAL